MLYVFWGISFLGNTLYSFSKKNPWIKRLVLALTYIFMLILLGWARGSNDIEVGIARYNNFQSFESFTEIGYSLLISFAKGLGWNYRQFFLTWAFVEITTIFWFVCKNTKESPIVFGFFLIWPMVGFFPLTRSLAAFVFVLIGINGLINKTKGCYVKYVVLVIIASSIHFSSLFFLTYLVVYFISRKGVLILSVISFVLLYLSTGIELFSRMINQYVGEKRVEIVLGSVGAAGMFGRVFAVVFTIGEFFFMYFFLVKKMRVDMSDEITDFFFKINILSFIFVPLIINFGIGFARFPTLISLINYCFIVNKVSTIRSQRKRIASYAILGVIVLGLAFMNMRNLEYREVVAYPFFDQNEFVQWLFQ